MNRRNFFQTLAGLFALPVAFKWKPAPPPIDVLKPSNWGKTQYSAIQFYAPMEIVTDIRMPRNTIIFMNSGAFREQPNGFLTGLSDELTD